MTNPDADPMALASCKGHDPALWDTVTRRGRTSRLGVVTIGGVRMKRPVQIALARLICNECPVITLCALLGQDEEEGIWAGKLPDER